MKKFILLSLLFTFLRGSSQEWEPTYGPIGSRVYAIGSFNSKIFISTEFANFYSENNGDSWKTLNLPVYIWAYATCGNKILAGGNGGIFISNNGVLWQQADGMTAIGRIVVDNGNIYASGQYNKFYFSCDSGNTWQSIGDSLPTDYTNGLTVMNGTIYLTKGSDQTQLFSSSDTGKTWNATSFPVGWISCLSNDGINLFAGSTFNGVYISSDKGNSWAPLNAVLPVPYFYIEDLIVEGNFMYAATRNGIYKCMLGSYVWENKGLSDYFLFRIIRHNGNLFAGSDYNSVFRSANDGDSWQQLYKGIYAGKKIDMMASSGGTLWAAGSFWGGLYKSIDNGDNWITVTEQRYYNALLVNGDNIYVADFESSSIWISHDGGASFLFKPTPGQFRISSIAEKDNILYCTDYGLFRSTDQGNTWLTVPIQPSFTPHNLFISSNYIFTISYGEMFRSRDGNTWQSCEPDSCFLYDLTQSDEGLFLATSKGIYLSTDEGSNWILQMNIDLPEGELLYLSAVGNILYFYNMTHGPYGSEQPHGIYASPDKGDHWFPVNTGLTELSYNCLQSHNNKLFGGVSYAGVYRLNYETITVKETGPEATLNVFPNPSASGKFFIQSGTGEGMKIQLFSSNGKLIFDSMKEEEFTVDLSGKADGIYLIIGLTDKKKLMSTLILLR